MTEQSPASTKVQTTLRYSHNTEDLDNATSPAEYLIEKFL